MAKDKTVDERESMKYLHTIELADDTEVDVYEVSPNVVKFVFKKNDKKNVKGLELVEE